MSSSFVPSPPPPGLNYLAAIQPSMSLLMIGTIWSSMLIPVITQVLLPRKTPMVLFQVRGQTKLKKLHARKPSAQVMEEEAILTQVLAAEEEDARPDGGTIEVDSEL
ncbi:hypothetical protein DFH08DRAFT_796431 [Mycena albidolilacea]|uniref:Uncharacterized protein n=1 Tax=Mycena albidolilacea TaxID=1033008 RepID=A0AAD7F787_9AGAR|nr:hypothetical protein DFH08DRAFT_796431 [Mycena albidolilacea]